MYAIRSYYGQNPDIFWEYIKTNMDYTGIHPNAGQRILAKWENELELSIVTQNIEQLHTQAGSKKVTKVHGSLMTCTCQGCQRGYSLHEVINKKQGYLCGCGSVIKPDIVLYEESVDKMTEVFKQAKTADCLLVLGTSLTVVITSYSIHYTKLYEKVVYYDVFYDYSPEEREHLLSELNNDSRILFAFKEYMSGDIC